jgi:hypothetical protein
MPVTKAPSKSASAALTQPRGLAASATNGAEIYLMESVAIAHPTNALKAPEPFSSSKSPKYQKGES